MERLTVLFIDDETEPVENLMDRLRKFRHRYVFESLRAKSADEGLALARTHHTDLIFLDILMDRQKSGFRVLEGLERERRTRAIPVIIYSITANLTEGYDTIKRGLALNALWVLGKDMPIDVLDSYLERALEYVEDQRPDQRDVSAWPLYYEPGTGQLIVDAKPRDDIHLTPHQRHFLALVCEHPGMICTHDEVARYVFGKESVADVSEDQLNTLLYDVRHLLGDDAADPRMIETVRSIGYRLKRGLPSNTFT